MVLLLLSVDNYLTQSPRPGSVSILASRITDTVSAQTARIVGSSWLFLQQFREAEADRGVQEQTQRQRRLSCSRLPPCSRSAAPAASWFWTASLSRPALPSAKSGSCVRLKREQRTARDHPPTKFQRPFLRSSCSTRRSCWSTVGPTRKASQTS